MSTDRPSLRRIELPVGLAAAAMIAASVCVCLTLAGLVLFVHRTVAGSRDQTTVTAGGLHYSVNHAWVLHPRRAVDADLARGLPLPDAHLPQDELLYAVFVGVTNETGTALPMVSDIALRDTRNIEYAPTPPAPENAFAYRPGVLAGKSHLPAPQTPAATDLSADGLMLVFRIPPRSYDDGPLQLVLRDPLRPGSVKTVETS